jgi:hypothetical protein
MTEMHVIISFNRSGDTVGAPVGEIGGAVRALLGEVRALLGEVTTSLVGIAEEDLEDDLDDFEDLEDLEGFDTSPCAESTGRLLELRRPFFFKRRPEGI